MLSDKEMIVIKYLKKCKDYRETKILIEKQSKKIEELKQALEKRIKYCNELEKDLFENCSNYVVSKAKIKAKIEELEKDLKEYENGQEWEIQDEIRGQIYVLESLLEEEE